MIQLTLHVNLTKPSNLCLLLCSVHLNLEHPLSTLHPLILDLQQKPQISPPSHPLPLGGPGDVEEAVNMELRGGEKVVGEELEAFDAEAEEVAVRESYDESWEVVRYGRVGWRGCV